MNRGFTLIELSIVLVIIGLIVGGVLVGQDLINAAAARAQITQIEKYNTAVNTFRGKYNDQLPGDIDSADASQFGFASRGTDCSGSPCAGEGDGNGLIQGIDGTGSGHNVSDFVFNGEEAMFWVDLSTAGLIDGSFNTATAGAKQTSVTVSKFLPPAKIGSGVFVSVWSGGYQYENLGSGTEGLPGDSTNYFAISTVIGTSATCGGMAITSPGLTPVQAYSIDKKVDDGYPQSGKVMAMSANCSGLWSSGGTMGNYGTEYAGAQMSANGSAFAPVSASSNMSTPPGSTTCYDNNSNASGNATEQYSVSTNGGLNCNLSFKFQ